MNAQIQQLANKHRGSLKDFRFPFDVNELARRKGFSLEWREFQDKDIHGMIIIDKTNSRTAIAVNHKLSNKDDQFNVAHEMGHYFLHYKDEAKFARCERESSRQNAASLEEKQADEFARALLMPEEIVQAAVRIYKEDKEPKSYPLVGYLSEMFVIPEQQVKERLVELFPATA